MARPQSLSNAPQTLGGHTAAVALTEAPVLLSAGGPGNFGSGEIRLFQVAGHSELLGVGCGRMAWVSQMVLISSFHFLWKSHALDL